MLLSHFGCRKDRDEICGGGGFFYIWAAIGIRTLDEAHNAYYFKAIVACGFDGLHGGGTGGAHIVHDHHLRAFLAEAFDTLAGAVLLLGLAHEEAVDGSAGDSEGDYDGVRTHGQSADCGRFPALLADFSEEDFADELRAAGVARTGSGVVAKIPGAPRGQLKAPQAERLCRKHFPRD